MAAEKNSTDQPTTTFTIDWSDLRGTDAQETYMASLSFSLIGLGISFLLAAFILASLVLRCGAAAESLRENCIGEERRGGGWRRCCCSIKPKWVAVGVSMSAFVLSVLSWSIFLSLPSVLQASGFCPPQTFLSLYASDNDLWCASFVGNRRWALSETLRVEVVWVPFVGWWFSLMGTLCILLAFCATLCITRRHHSPYHLLDSSSSSFSSFPRERSLSTFY